MMTMMMMVMWIVSTTSMWIPSTLSSFSLMRCPRMSPSPITAFSSFFTPTDMYSLSHVSRPFTPREQSRISMTLQPVNVLDEKKRLAKRGWREVKNWMQKIRYFPLAELGRGAFGTVILARDLLGNPFRSTSLVAIKGIRKNAGREAFDVVAAVNLEYHITKEYGGRNGVVGARSLYETPTEYKMVLDRATGDDLFELRTKWGPNPITDDAVKMDMARKIVFKVAKTLKYLHDNQVVYSDLKLENIVVDVSGRNAIDPKVTLVDLGCAQPLAHLSPLPFSEGNTARRAFLCGNPDYYPPEYATFPDAFRNRGAYPDLYKTDLYTLGIFTYLLVVGHYPWAMITTPPSPPAQGQNATPAPETTQRRQQVHWGNMRWLHCREGMVHQRGVDQGWEHEVWWRFVERLTTRQDARPVRVDDTVLRDPWFRGLT